MTRLPDRSTLLLPFREGALNGAEPLRVGVVLGHCRPSPWVDALLSFLRQIPGIDVRLFAVTDRSRAAKRPSWLMDRLYSASRARFDPFGDVAFDGTKSTDPESAEAIRAADCGVLIWLAAVSDSSLNLGRLAKYGAFTVRLGERDRPIAFWDEVADNRATSKTTIYWHESSFLRGRAVRKVETSTSHRLFFTTNAEEPLVAVIRVFASFCLEIRQGGRQFGERLRGFPEGSIEIPPPLDYPTSLEVGRFVLRNLAGNAQRRRAARGKDDRWFVAMRPNSGASVPIPAGWI